MNEWIISTAEILGGKPCIRGTRISVEFILELLASGAKPEDILQSYPHITIEGLKAALEYAARSLKNEVVWELKISA
jgi:uncharacterized protein (DUF433 family)